MLANLVLMFGTRKSCGTFGKSFLRGKFSVLNFDGNCYMLSVQIWLLRSESVGVEKR